MQDLVLVALTSQLTGADPIAIDPADCVGGVLPKRSAVKPSKMFTIHSSLVVKRICAIAPRKVDQILEQIRAFFS